MFTPDHAPILEPSTAEEVKGSQRFLTRLALEDGKFNAPEVLAARLDVPHYVDLDEPAGEQSSPGDFAA